MFQHHRLNNEITLFQKIKNLDYILLISVILLSALSVFVMYLCADVWVGVCPCMCVHVCIRIWICAVRRRRACVCRCAGGCRHGCTCMPAYISACMSTSTNTCKVDVASCKQTV